MNDWIFWLLAFYYCALYYVSETKPQTLALLVFGVCPFGMCYDIRYLMIQKYGSHFMIFGDYYFDSYFMKLGDLVI